MTGTALSGSRPPASILSRAARIPSTSAQKLLKRNMLPPVTSGLVSGRQRTRRPEVAEGTTCRAPTLCWGRREVARNRGRLNKIARSADQAPASWEAISSRSGSRRW